MVRLTNYVKNKVQLLTGIASCGATDIIPVKFTPSNGGAASLGRSRASITGITPVAPRICLTFSRVSIKVGGVNNNLKTSMRNTFLAVSLMVGLVFVGCVKKTPTPTLESASESQPSESVNQPVEPAPSISTEDANKVDVKVQVDEADKVNDIAKAGEAPVKPVSFVPYDNKAVGYSIERPDKWYWQHYLKNEIGDKEPMADDYFMTDPQPLTQIGALAQNRIVIEVSRRDVNDVRD